MTKDSPTGSGNDLLLKSRLRRDALLQQLLYWSAPVPDWVPPKKSKNSNLRIACVLEERLLRGLQFEAEILLLTPNNWKQVLRYAKPDIVLIESAWRCATGHWHLGQSPASPQYEELVAIVREAKSLAIPTVFWVTRGAEYHEHFKDYARLFDEVFCADPLELEKLSLEGISANLLLPCVQPALYNPFRRLEQCQGFGLNIIFDGWADIDRLGSELALLEKLIPFGLSIVESRYQIFKNRLGMQSKFKDCILGSVTFQGRLTLLKYAQVYATLERSLSSNTTQQWMALEAAACRLPVVHHGMLAEDDPRKGCVIECPVENDFLVELVRQMEDNHYRERLAHLSWRTVNLHHTFSHRLRTICEKLGLTHNWDEYPKASLITPTYRKRRLPKCLETFEAQTYPNKELVIAFNGDEEPSLLDLGMPEARRDVIVAHVPGEMFAGAALNVGNLNATGMFWFRVDDDDHYGPNYILDMMLHARSIDAALFGKPAAPITFEADSRVYIRKNGISLVVMSREQLSSVGVWIGGNSLAGSSEFLGANKYSDLTYGSADSEFLLNLPEDQESLIAIFDPFNLVAERREDLASHTWRRPPHKLMGDRRKLRDIDEVFI